MSELFHYCKLQFACLIVTGYITYMFFRLSRKQKRNGFFIALLIIATVELLLDGLTSWSVNHLDVVPKWANDCFHLLFFFSLMAVMYDLFLFFFTITHGVVPTRSVYLLFSIPLFLSACAMTFFIPQLEYRTGVWTNYSMGVSVYICFGTLAVVIFATLFLIFTRYRYIEKYNRRGIFTCVVGAAVLPFLQGIIPEFLCSSAAITLFVVGCFCNLENPAIRNLEQYHAEIISSFATLVENRDTSTGGHVKRTSAYVEVILQTMLSHSMYRRALTKDYCKAVEQAAPLHDIGKIVIPDSILQKPGRLTPDEFTIMKTHAVRGSEIIHDTFSRLNEDDFYTLIACQVARFHHERWDGSGYPEGLQGEDIPLAARIMAVADVFDALSEARCYRDALPLDQCFEMIERGSGTDFDPDVVSCFLAARATVEQIHMNNR